MYVCVCVVRVALSGGRKKKHNLHVLTHTYISRSQGQLFTSNGELNSPNCHGWEA